MNPDILISTTGFILTLIIALWRMNASQIKRTDQLSRSLRGDISELRSEVRNDISGLRSEVHNDISGLRSEVRNDMSEFRSEVRNDMSELHKGQKKLIDSTAKLDSRISRLEGMLQPRPWVEAPTGDMPPVSATRG